MKLPQPNDRQRAIASNRAAGLDTGLNVTGYLIGGLVAYGFIGWLVGRLVHADWPLPAGMLIGLVISTAYVIYRYGISPRGDDPPGSPRTREAARPPVPPAGDEPPGTKTPKGATR